MKKLIIILSSIAAILFLARKKIKLIFLFILIAMGYSYIPYVIPEWIKAPITYICSEEEATKVRKETYTCTQDMINFYWYCHGNAIQKNCKMKEK